MNESVFSYFELMTDVG